MIIPFLGVINPVIRLKTAQWWPTRDLRIDNTSDVDVSSLTLDHMILFVNGANNIKIDDFSIEYTSVFIGNSAVNDGVIITNSRIGTDGVNKLDGGLQTRFSIVASDNVRVGGIGEGNIISIGTEVAFLSNVTFLGNGFGYNFNTNQIIPESQGVKIGSSDNMITFGGDIPGESNVFLCDRPATSSNKGIIYTTSFSQVQSGIEVLNNFFGTNEDGTVLSAGLLTGTESYLQLGDENTATDRIAFNKIENNTFYTNGEEAITVADKAIKNTFYNNIITTPTPIDGFDPIELVGEANENIIEPAVLKQTGSVIDGLFVKQLTSSPALKRIELFASNEFGTEATQRLGYVETGFTTNDNLVDWSLTLTENYEGFVVATATDVNNNTSELSEPFFIYGTNYPPFAVELPLNNTIYVPAGATDN